MPAPPTTPALTPALLDELSQVALKVASGAAQILAGYWRGPLTAVSTKSSPTDLVSEADRASEAYILGELRQARPDDSVLGEEGAAHHGTSGISWVADPLDGTTNFYYGVPAYAVSLAARTGGSSVVGVVVDPSRQETWTAAQGGGAFLNGAPCRLPGTGRQLATALVATGFGYQRERREQQAALLPRLLSAVRDIRRFGSAALDLCWVAAGRYDAYYESHLSPWDWAAGRLVCEEAGGMVRELPGEILLASAPEISEDLAQLLAG